jgi:hypothetical protein
MKDIYTIAKKKNKELVFEETRYLKAFLKQFKENEEFEVHIKRLVPNRTYRQNRYYWAIVEQVRELLNSKEGYDKYSLKESEIIHKEFTEDFEKEDIHFFLKWNFNKEEIVNKTTGEITETIGNTSDLSIEEFNEYIKKIENWLYDKFNYVLQKRD